ncbi:MAG: aminotransferase class I/II-fold pyridoxal phosphate-dependent enzyme, partial [Clostridia bacterium]|nr:aminotransferase class I/II-fold pyridoxal phosphate-dependent enzyme [Clostridia bacterium]
MVNEKMRGLGACRSVIRELFEYGKKRKAEIGDENVFDFSIGNPSVPSPAIVNETLTCLLQEKDAVSLHGYTSAQGDAGVRRAIADYVASTHNATVNPDLIYLTVGAAASLTISLSALTVAGDEVILLAPFFPEYRVFVERNGAVAVPVLCDTKTFQPDLDAIRAVITPKTRAIIVNSPNNPTGAVMTKESIEGLSALLSEASKENGQPIYLIADEP